MFLVLFVVIKEEIRMKIAVLSDIHDNIWNLDKVLPHLSEAQTLILCGDLCSPFTLRKIADSFSEPVHCVLGNNDGDILLLTRVAAQAGNVTLYNPWGEIEVGDKKIAFAHYPEIAAGLVPSGKYQAVFNGHTHKHKAEKAGDTLWVNPGEVMGLYGRSTYVLYDTETGEFSLEEIA